MTSGDVFTATLVRYLFIELPALVALVVAIVLAVATWSRDRRRGVMGIGAFVLALVGTVVWPVVVATTAWLATQGRDTPGMLLTGAADFAFRVLTGLAWLLIVLALFPGRARAARGATGGSPPRGRGPTGRSCAPGGR